MARKRYSAEQIIGHLRQAEILISEGKTNRGSEFKGAFDEACQSLGIRHTRTKPRHAWTNGFVERLQGTILHEHWCVAFRRRSFTARPQLDRSLQRYLAFSNDDSAGAGRPGEDSHRLPVERLIPVGTEAARAGSARWRSTSCASSGLRQARAGYRLRRCPVRLPRWACPQGWAVPRVARWAGRRVRWMGWPAGTAGCSTADCRRWDVAAGICSHRPSRSPARHARAASSRSGARRTRSSFVGPRAGAGLDGDVRTTMVGTDYAKGPSTRWASSSSRTCAAIRLALGDQDLRLAQVADKSAPRNNAFWP